MENSQEDKCLKLITDYINAPKTDYAILINGQWGCGKTYHIRNNIFPTIKKISISTDKLKKCPTINYLSTFYWECDYWEKQFFTPLYISLYGLSSIEEIHTRILEERFPFLKGKMAMAINTGLNGVCNFFGIDSKHKDELSSFASIESNYVLFFDDLERINAGAVSIKSVLGHINTYTEHKNLKVIVISNDAEQTDKHYQQFKEKTVRFSQTFSAEIEDVFDIMCANKTEPYKKHIQSQKDYILNIFTSANCQNLRTLRFLIDIFEEVHKMINVEKYAELILRKLLLFTTIYTIEYKNGATQQQLETLRNFHNNIFSNSISDFLDESYNTPPENNTEINNETPKDITIYVDETIVKYNVFEYEFKYIPEITSLIHEGYLCSEDLAKTISKITEELISINDTDEGILLNKIINWRDMENDEFNSSVTQLIAYVNEGRYTIPQLLKGYAPLVVFHFKEIESFQITPYVQSFKDAIDKAKVNHKYDLSFRFTYSIWDEDDKSESAKLFNEMLQYACDANDSVLQVEKQSKLDYFLNLIKSNNSELLKNYRFGIDDNINFLDIPIERLMPLLYTANSKTIHALHNVIYHQYPKGRGLNKKEETQINKLFTNLDNYLKDQKPRTVSIVNLYDLRNHLENILTQNNQSIS